jgi:hypothetical protein
MSATSEEHALGGGEGSGDVPLETATVYNGRSAPQWPQLLKIAARTRPHGPHVHATVAGLGAAGRGRGPLENLGAPDKSQATAVLKFMA